MFNFFESIISFLDQPVLILFSFNFETNNFQEGWKVKVFSSWLSGKRDESLKLFKYQVFPNKSSLS